MAFDAIRQTDARYKHVILMTDGMSCCGGDYPGVQDRIRGANITLSTTAVGGDADQQLLQQLAKQATVATTSPNTRAISRGS
jgi:Ca-activated chloride channel homolog